MAETQTIRRLPRQSPGGRVVHCIRMGAADSLRLAVCSEKPEWFVGHWQGSYTIRCTGDHLTCEGCLHLDPIREKGYLTVRTLVHCQPLLLELTGGAGDYLEEAFPDVESIRGHWIRVFRMRPHKNAPLVIERLEPVAEDFELPPHQDPLPTLLRLWKSK